MGSEEVKVMMTLTDPAAASTSLKLRGSPRRRRHRLKRVPHPSVASRVTEDQNLNQKQLDGPLNVSIVNDVEEGEIVVDRELDVKCQERLVRKAYSRKRLRKDSDVASPSAKVEFEVSLDEPNCVKQDISNIRQRLDPMLKDDMPAQDSAATMVEAKNLAVPVIVDPPGTQSMFIEKEKVKKRKQRRKRSKYRKQQKKELKKQADELRLENSKLSQKMMKISEQCEEVNSENDSILDELEKALGADAVSDLRAIQALLKTHQSIGNSEKTSHTSDQESDKDPSESEFNKKLKPSC